MKEHTSLLYLWSCRPHGGGDRFSHVALYAAAIVLSVLVLWGASVEESFAQVDATPVFVQNSFHRGISDSVSVTSTFGSPGAPNHYARSMSESIGVSSVLPGQPQQTSSTTSPALRTTQYLPTINQRGDERTTLTLKNMKRSDTLDKNMIDAMPRQNSEILAALPTAPDSFDDYVEGSGNALDPDDSNVFCILDSCIDLERQSLLEGSWTEGYDLVDEQLVVLSSGAVLALMMIPAAFKGGTFGARGIVILRSIMRVNKRQIQAIFVLVILFLAIPSQMWVPLAQAAITYVGAGTVSSTTSGNSKLTPGLPSGLQPGDIMIAYFYSNNILGGTVSAPSGWQQIYNHLDTGGLTGIWWKVFQTGDTAPTISVTGHALNAKIAQVAAWRGVDTTSPIDAQGSVSTNLSAQDIGPISGITIAANSVVIVVGGKRSNWTSVATLSGDGLTWNEIAEPSVSGAGLVWDYAINSNTGTTITSKTFSVSGGLLATGKGVMFSLKMQAGQEFSRTLADSITITDSITKVGLFTRSISDSLTIDDEIVAKVTARAVAEELTLTDAISAKVTARAIADSLTIGDEVVAKVTGRAIADELIVTDEIAAKVTGRAISDQLSITDEIAAKVVVRAISEELIIADEISAKVTARAIDDQLTVADTISAKITVRAIADSLTIGDEIAAKVTGRAISDQLSITDEIAATIVTAAIADTLTATDSISFHITKSMSDSIVVTDTVTAVAGTVFGRDYRALVTTTGTTNTDTSVSISTSGAANYIIQPYTTGSGLTGTPSNSIPSGFGWRTPGVFGETVPAGTWSFAVQTNTSGVTLGTGEAFVHVYVYSTDTIGRNPQFIGTATDNVDILTLSGGTVNHSFSFSASEVDLTNRVLVVEYWIIVTSPPLLAATSAFHTVSTVTSVTLPTSPATTYYLSTPRLHSMGLEDSVITVDSIAKSYSGSRPVTDSIMITDAINIRVTRSITEDITVLEQISLGVSKSLLDTVTIADETTANIAARVITDQLIVTDEIVAKVTARAVAEELTLTDAISAKVTARAIADSLTIGDEIAAKVTARAVSDSLTLNDEIIAKVVTRAISDQLTISDSIAATIAGVAISDTLTLTDAISAKVTARVIADELIIADEIVAKVTGRGIGDSLSITDGIVGAVGPIFGEDYRTLVEIHGDIDTRTRVALPTVLETTNYEVVPYITSSITGTPGTPSGHGWRTAGVHGQIIPAGTWTFTAETKTTGTIIGLATASLRVDVYSTDLSGGDIQHIGTANSGVNLLENTLGVFVDEQSHTFTFDTDEQVDLTDRILVVEYWITVSPVNLELLSSEVAYHTVSDVTSVQLPTSTTIYYLSTARSYLVGISESITTADTIAAKIIARAIADTLTVSDSITAAIAGTSIDDQLTIHDEIVAKVTARAVAEELTLTDAISAKVTARAIADSLTIGDEIAAKVTARAVSDSLTLNDEIIAKVVTRAISDQLTISDSIAATIAGVAISDTLTLTDAISAKVTARVIADELIIADEIVAKVTGRGIFDALTISDSIAATLAGTSIDDQLTIHDEIVAKVTGGAMFDELTLTDSISMSISRSITDEISITDETSLVNAYTIPIADNLSVTDEVERVRVVSRTVDDLLGISDTISIRIAFILAETITITDATKPPLQRAISDSLEISDEISAISGIVVRINDSLSIVPQLTDISVHWNRSFNESVMLGDCTPFACNIPLHLGEPLSLSDQFALLTAASKTLTDTLGISDTRTFKVQQAPPTPPPGSLVSPLGAIIVSDRSLATPISSVPVPGTFTMTSAGELWSQLNPPSVSVTNMVSVSDLPTTLLVLPTYQVNLNPTQQLPGQNALLTIKVAEIPKSTPVIIPIDISSTPALTNYNHVPQMVIQFTPKVDSTDFALVVTIIDDPPQGAPQPTADLKKLLYFNVQWVGDFELDGDGNLVLPSSSDYYESPPTFTFALTDEWANEHNAQRNENGVPIVSLRLLDEPTNTWTEMTNITMPAGSTDGQYIYTVQLDHFSTYVITASAVAPPSSGDRGTILPAGQELAVQIVDSIIVSETHDVVAIEVIEEHVGMTFNVAIADRIMLLTRPIAHHTFTVGENVAVSISLDDIRQRGTLPQTAYAVFLVRVANSGADHEAFQLNFWYYDQAGTRAYEFSQRIDIGPSETVSKTVEIPFASAGTFVVVAEARSIPEDTLLNTARFTVTIPWLFIYLNTLLLVAGIIITASVAAAIIFFMQRHSQIQELQRKLSSIARVIMFRKRLQKQRH